MKVREHIAEKLKNEPEFRERYDLILQKAEIAEKIIDYRIKHDLTQAELAKELGVSQQYVSKIEEGRFSNLETIENVLFRLGYKLKLKVESVHTH
jgi:DNA-binding XRE family transcriptional regulator